MKRNKTSIWNGLKRNKQPNKYSLNKIDQLNGEVKARIALCKRAGGTPVVQNELVKRNDGTEHIIKRVLCVGGKCECGCGKRGVLEPHESPKRSAGGKVSLKQSKMLLRECHMNKHPKPKLAWIKW